MHDDVDGLEPDDEYDPGGGGPDGSNLGAINRASELGACCEVAGTRGGADADSADSSACRVPAWDAVEDDHGHQDAHEDACDDDDYDDDAEWAALEERVCAEAGGAVVGASSSGLSKSSQLSARFDSLVSLAPLSSSTRLSQAASNELGRTERKAATAGPSRGGGLSRDSRATTEHVLDPRTRLLLFKLLNAGTLGAIHGCVSTGKEANVYHAEGPNGDIAVKVRAAIGAVVRTRRAADPATQVYKTSVLTFKDRDRYVSGEFRWRHGYCRSNPRKMVRLWAEKEMRNYRRLEAAGVPCPAALLLREHVLLMEFVGTEGYAAPRLKDAPLSAESAASAAEQVVLILRRIYQNARLVHADFSEYNLLWHRKQVVVIDVSQAVEHDHPNALVFLRKVRAKHPRRGYRRSLARAAPGHRELALVLPQVARLATADRPAPLRVHHDAGAPSYSHLTAATPRGGRMCSILPPGDWRGRRDRRVPSNDRSERAGGARR